MIKAITIIVLLIILGLSCIFYFGMENPPVSLTLASPNKTYIVQLNEKADRFLSPIHFDSRRFPSEVRFNVYKDSQMLAQDEFLWSDTSDSRLDVYKYRWVSNSVLKYSWDETLPESKKDELLISNDTDQTINYLIINAREHFLAVDIQPRASVKLQAFPQSWLSWISCKGSFSSGKAIRWNGVNFPIRDNNQSHLPQHYCISVRDYGVLIQSQEIEGYKDLNGVDISVPKCGVNPSSEDVSY